jgi:hypothetical protein
MNSKSHITFRTLLFGFYEIFVLLLVAFTMVVFVMHFMSIDLNIFNVQGEVFVQGLLQSKNGISYNDNGVVHPGIIDYNIFKQKPGLQQQLSNAFYFQGQKPISAKIELMSGNAAYRALEPIYYNEEHFDAWYALGKTLFRGPGSSQVMEKYYPVIVKDGNTYDKAVLKITVAIPNS